VKRKKARKTILRLSFLRLKNIDFQLDNGKTCRKKRASVTVFIPLGKKNPAEKRKGIRKFKITLSDFILF
jgi:hypothetical protein